MIIIIINGHFHSRKSLNVWAKYYKRSFKYIRGGKILYRYINFIAKELNFVQHF